jgi:hypothetical protein
MLQNGVTQIANGYALRAAAYVPDRLPPFLLSWTLDMNSGAMSLTFNEPVSLPSFDPTAITLQQAQVCVGRDFHRVIHLQ